MNFRGKSSVVAALFAPQEVRRRDAHQRDLGERGEDLPDREAAAVFDLRDPPIPEKRVFFREKHVDRAVSHSKHGDATLLLPAAARCHGRSREVDECDAAASVYHAERRRMRNDVMA